MSLKIDETIFEAIFRETSMRDLTAVVVLGREKLQFNPPRYLGSKIYF